MMSDFKPMLCKSATVKDVEQGLFSPLEWTAEMKVDGVRAWMHDGHIYDRRCKEITEKFPELADLAKSTEGMPYILDGEIVAQDWEFNNTAGRMHMKDALYIKVASKSKPCMFVVFDHISTESTDIPNGRQIMRSSRLDTFVLLEFGEQMKRNTYLKIGELEQVCRVVESGEPKEMLKRAKAEGWEGIVLKRKSSTYQYKRSSDWRKVKLFIEVQHTFTKFEENSHGVTIEDDDGRRVVVNGRKAVDVKEAFAKHGHVTAEIQFLPQKNSTAWRFPSFRGVVKEAKGNGSTRENQ